MSVDSVKAQLATLLGSNGLPYWRSLSDFLAGKASRTEFERDVRQWINTAELVQLHNALLMSMVVASRLDPSKDSSGGGSSNHPSRKRRRHLPHQDPPPKLRKWVVGLRKTERDRVRGILSTSTAVTPFGLDDMRLERPIMLRKEGRNAAGTRVPVQLSSASRTLPGTQNLAERISLIASQNNLTAAKSVVNLASAAIEAYIKQLAMDALALTASPLTQSHQSHLQVAPTTTLSLASFSSLLTIIPSSLPAPSAAVDKMFLRGTAPDPPDQQRKQIQDAIDAGLDPQLAQYWGLLSRRSGVRDYLEGA